jgi:hypothetical protein
MGAKRKANRVAMENLKESDRLQDPGIDKRIILKLILTKYDEVT